MKFKLSHIHLREPHSHYHKRTKTPHTRTLYAVVCGFLSLRSHTRSTTTQLILERDSFQPHRLPNSPKSSTKALSKHIHLRIYTNARIMVRSFYLSRLANFRLHAGGRRRTSAWCLTQSLAFCVRDYSMLAQLYYEYNACNINFTSATPTRPRVYVFGCLWRPHFIALSGIRSLTIYVYTCGKHKLCSTKMVWIANVRLNANQT